MSSSNEKLLIVNADDLGRTTGINSGVFEAHSNGLVTSATLMVAFPAAVEAASRLDDFPDLGVGLHVALTGVPSILPTERLPSLTDASGRFHAKPEGLVEPAPEEVLMEARAQFDRFLELTGRLPTHLDSHHHSHRHPVVCDALVALAREHDLPIRNASQEVGERLRRDGVATTDFFVEDFFGEDAQVDILIEILGGIQPGITEIMCHPAHVDDELRSTSGYADDRKRELEVLTSRLALQAVQDLGLRPVHFGTAWKS
ncbi:MAG: ChbG/HpnK family deacetylase [Thermoanaerobaculales bacterium]|nr:ChbG/HpnK family deacetylase [Thermoanaerobaculales bacterium]